MHHMGDSVKPSKVRISSEDYALSELINETMQEQIMAKETEKEYKIYNKK